MQYCARMHSPAKTYQLLSDTRSNIEYEALGKLQGLEKLHHYFIITNHKLLVAILSKYLATLSQLVRCIILRIH